jgi:hypothetical protein
MGDNLGPKGLSRGCKVPLLQIEVFKIVATEAGEPNAFVNLLDSEPLPGRHGRDIDPLSVQAEPSGLTAIRRTGQTELGCNVGPVRSERTKRFMSLSNLRKKAVGG